MASRETPMPDNMDTLAWRWLAFDALSLGELHDLLQLRSEIFVVEQNCVFQDIDGADRQGIHVLGGREGQLLAYARCFPPGVKFAEACIGRVATRAAARGQGLGHALMAQALSAVEALWGRQAIRIGAQAHLRAFYARHGFVCTGSAYIEDGIAHVEMLRPGV